MLLIRHGESEGNALGVFQGHAEYPLSARGEAEARAVAERLLGDEPRIDALWSSPLGRALQTATAIAEAHALDLRTDDRLKEIDIGAGSGLTASQIRERFPNWGRPGQRRGLLPGQEHDEDFGRRINAVVTDLLIADKTTVAVTHGGFISNLCRQLVGAEMDRTRMFRVWNCSITEVSMGRNGSFVLHRFNDANHLNLG